MMINLGPIIDNVSQKIAHCIFDHNLA